MGKELHENEHYEYTRNEEKEEYGLRIHFAVLEDAGNITFTASNIAGSSSGSCNVKVHSECLQEAVWGSRGEWWEDIYGDVKKWDEFFMEGKMRRDGVLVGR